MTASWISVARSPSTRGRVAVAVAGGSRSVLTEAGSARSARMKRNRFVLPDSTPSFHPGQVRVRRRCSLRCGTGVVPGWAERIVVPC